MVGRIRRVSDAQANSHHRTSSGRKAIRPGREQIASPPRWPEPLEHMRRDRRCLTRLIGGELPSDPSHNGQAPGATATVIHNRALDSREHAHPNARVPLQTSLSNVPSRSRQPRPYLPLAVTGQQNMLFVGSRPQKTCAESRSGRSGKRPR